MGFAARIIDSMEPAVIALIGTIFGGVGLKLVEMVMSRGSSRDTTAAQIRTELRGDLTGIKTELATVQAELDEWKAKYYDLKEQIIALKSELERHKQETEPTA